MRRVYRLWRRDRGNALVEFVVLSVVLLLPSLYLVLTLGSVQSAVFAADIIARDAARIHATEHDLELALQRSSEHARMVLEDFGLEGTDVVEISCSEDPCATAGGTVVATVRIPVPVPGLGPVLGQDGPIAVSSGHSVQVDQYRAGNA
ncbi:hypothetical protein JOD52_002089 [Brachybacterium muris]|uniref:hypothetical protein n=1 Tax=Brachybacterium muris TaxID=219301 RepID=UPI001EF864C9|nr:hypothetical protein [Brachybacterium muris]MBM7501249.1 hypothetical protein [Brachybacterium muris]MCT2262192.1 hypothetical protein [Brachybacterium muris]